MSTSNRWCTPIKDHAAAIICYKRNCPKKSILDIRSFKDVFASPILCKCCLWAQSRYVNSFFELWSWMAVTAVLIIVLWHTNWIWNKNDVNIVRYLELYNRSINNRWWLFVNENVTAFKHLTINYRFIAVIFIIQQSIRPLETELETTLQSMYACSN